MTSLCLAACPAAAQAQARDGSGDDPRDVPESINGPRQPDIQQVRVHYDPAGSLAVTVRLYEAYNSTSKTYPTFEAYIGSASYSYTYSCSAFNNGDVQIYGSVDPASSFSSVKVSGYDGTLTAARSISADGLETTFTVSSPAMANRNYICASGLELYRSDPYGHCSPSDSDCERISYSYTGDVASDFFFTGFAPQRPACDDGIDNDGDGTVDTADPDCHYSSQGTSEGAPPPACNNHRDDDGDGLIDLNDPGCSGASGTTEGGPPGACENRRDDDGDGLVDVNDPGCRGDSKGGSETDPKPVRSTFKFTSVKTTRSCRLNLEVEALPDLKPLKLFPWGKVEVTVRGVSGPGRKYRKTRRLPIAEDNGYQFTLKPGRYKISGRYPGDTFRLPSRTSTRTVTVCKQQL